MRPGVVRLNADPTLPHASLPGWAVCALDGLLAAGVLDGEAVDALSTVQLCQLARHWISTVSAGEVFDADEAVQAARNYERRAA